MFKKGMEQKGNRREMMSSKQMIVYIEMIGRDRFAISLHGFFSHELKDAIKKLDHAKYDMVNKVWMLPNSMKMAAIETIRNVC